MTKKQVLALLLTMLSLTITLVSMSRRIVSANEIEPKNYLPVILKPCTTGALVYSDDFSDPDSGWITFSTSEVEASYYGGEYRLLSKGANERLGLANGSFGISTAYMLEIDVRNVDGKPGEYGVIFGFEGALELDFYTFMIDPAGNYAIYYNEQVLPDPLQTTLLHSDWSAAIQPGTVSNKLGVVHTASTMEFYANGQLLTSLPSDRNGSEQSGMMAQAGNQANLDIRFDNIKLYEYLCAGADQPSAGGWRQSQPVDYVLNTSAIERTEP